MYISILGRQPALGIAELERLYTTVSWFSDQSATIKTDAFNFNRLGGSQKAGRVVAELSGDWRRVSQKMIQEYISAWSDRSGKITLGISAYGFNVSPREVQKAGIILKAKLKERGVSIRLIPNVEAALGTATSHHNKLGLSDNKVELLVIRNAKGNVIIAESVGAQNITAYTKRDQERPKRDAFVGMLPPKLAQMMINMAAPAAGSRVLDPFCGTGVVLQEAALQGYAVYGTDLADKMISFTDTNLGWLRDTHRVDVQATLDQGDAMTTKWQAPVDAVVAETYLGQPFSAPPSPTKLAEVRKNCDYIISTFLKNLADQVAPGTPVCIAIPAWRSGNGDFTHLPLVETVETLGFKQVQLKNARPHDLLYYRDGQIVARELLILVKG